MFSIDPKLSHLSAKREQIVAILESVNQPIVAIPGKAPQPVQAHVCGLRNPNATFSIYIYLLLAQTNDQVVYVYSDPQFPLEHYRDAEAEALQFVESMGFMVENLNFRTQPPEAQEEILARVPAFSAPEAKAPEKPSGPSAEAQTRAQELARLLAAF
ncbi:MAG: hypothetical protein ACYCWW_18670 [Deltaproteobacteria bacterium]